MVRDQVKNALAINNQYSAGMGMGMGPVGYQQNPMMGQQVPYEHSKNASMGMGPQHVDVSAGTSVTKSQIITA